MTIRRAAVVACLAAAVQSTGAQGTVPPRDQQIAAAVLPLPVAARASARVMGYGPDGKLVVIREGKSMTCLASDPKADRFHVACYHESMEPFMARGRALRDQGVKGDQVDTLRFKEVKAGSLKMPVNPASLFSLTGGVFDAKSGTAPGAKHLYVVYIPFATMATTGLPERPEGAQPWIMYPGTPKAHIMFMPGM